MHRKPYPGAIKNVSAATIVSPEIEKYVHLGIILEERNGEQGAKAESTVLVVCSKAVSGNVSGKGQ